MLSSKNFRLIHKLIECIEFKSIGQSWEDNANNAVARPYFSVAIWNRNRSASSLFAVGAQPILKPLKPVVSSSIASCRQFLCSAWNGGYGKLSSLSNNVAGSVTAHAACTVQLEQFTVNLTNVESAFIRAVDGGNNVAFGTDIFNLTRSYFNECVAFALPASMSFDSLAKSGATVTVLVWAKLNGSAEFANFGQATLLKGFPNPNGSPAQNVAASCSSCQPWVGAFGSLVTREHNVNGRVIVGRDCSFRIEQFNYDGAAPDVSFRAVRGSQASALKPYGYHIGALPTQRAYRNECLAIQIEGAATFEQIADSDNTIFFSVWCLSK